MTSRCFLSPTCCGFATNFTFILRIVGGNKIEIGVASAKSLTRVSFSSIYEGWSAKNVYVDLDAALVGMDHSDLRCRCHWEACRSRYQQLSLRLIGCPVHAFGASKKVMQTFKNCRSEICQIESPVHPQVRQQRKR
jgi:hypothetical protein